MKQIRILWADDEIDLLRPHIRFLEKKNYLVDTATNGSDAIRMVREEDYDIIFLDENMPGLSGLETLQQIKNISSRMPVIMITKSEEENIMDEAIGSKINDYLIKPVNPNQILLAIKKNIDKERLVTEKTTSSYLSDFTKISTDINVSSTYHDWYSIYSKLTHWDLELEASHDSTMEEVFALQMNEANAAFSKFIKENYVSWFNTKNDDKPLLSPNLLTNKVFPLLRDGKKVLFLLMDNLRYDHWKAIEPILSQFYSVQEDAMMFSILPTSTQYSRNAIFSGLMPSEINKLYPELWLNDDEEGGKNNHEEEMLRTLMQRYSIKTGLYFDKIIDIKNCKKITDNVGGIAGNNFISIVINFVDALSHARTDQKMIRELAYTTTNYRSITKSWFSTSPLLEMLKVFAQLKYFLVIGTDHGSIQINNPVKIIGDKNTTTNLRYKQGKNLNYNRKNVFEVLNPGEVYLPKTNISSTYVFAYNSDFFAYPNNYNHYVQYYKGTFQHGGISMQEMITPIITLKAK